MLLGRRCGVCGRRGWRSCGARTSERSAFPDGGYFYWRKWSPCSEYAPGGVHPDAGKMDECGDLDLVRSGGE
jgi:hypothetical protein